MIDVVSEPLKCIWNEEIIGTGSFPANSSLLIYLPFTKNLKLSTKIITDQLVFCLLCQRSMNESWISKLTLTLKNTYLHTYVDTGKAIVASMHYWL